MACFPIKKSIGKENSQPSATMLRKISIQGTGHEFHACVYEEEDCLQCDLIRILFVGHDVKALVQVSVEPFD